MQTENRLFDDIARMANGALNTLSGLRDEIETRVKERVERLLADMDLITREEFDAARDMAQKARTEQEDLARRVATLERRVGELEGATPKATSARAPSRRATKQGGTTRPKKSATTRSSTKAEPTG